MKKLLFILLLIPSICFSDNLYMGAWSKHFSNNEETNETHNLLGYEKNNYFALYFKNSFKVDSGFVGKRFNKQITENINVYAMTGLVYGYSDCLRGGDEGSKKVCPFIAPGIKYTKYKIEPNLILFGNAVALSFSIDI